jgi:glucan phosphoethanolaminetransferase (alkaline phosphatase superfamily)
MSREKKTSEVLSNPINYLFFGFYFLVLSFIHIYHVFLIERSISFSTYFFLAYALGQCVIETLILVIFAGLIHHYLPRAKNLFIFLVFFLFVSRLVDFPLVRLMDMSFWFALNFVVQMSYSDFIELLIASNVSILVWIVAGLAGISLLLSGIFLFRVTEKWALKRRWALPFSKFAMTICSISVFLTSWDFSVKNRISHTNFDRFEKTLPWKYTFFPPKTDYLSLKAALQEPRGEEELIQSLDSRFFSLARRPDIYLFIVESLREDYLTSTNTPVLSRFREENVSFDLALANANATHISWFSLFHSQFPFYWGKTNPEDIKEGSIPLRLLKKMGYKIYVSSSARLGYFQMDRVIFGEGERLADFLFISEDEDIGEPYARDQKAIDNLLLEMQKGSSGRLFIVFLDATHHDYSWPSEMTKFFPFDEKVNYISAAISNGGLDKIKNRYRNALYFIDGQFGKFFKALDASPGGSDAVVVVTGDHGEEFYEHGNLFHASGLTQPQIHVPLYYRLGQNSSMRSQCKMTSHMDIFPTLFHYLIGEDLVGDVLQGESIFKLNRWPFAVVSRFNAVGSPYEFCIHNGARKITASFIDRKNIFNSKALKIHSLRNCHDEIILKEPSAVQEEFGPALERIFSAKR